MSRRSVPLVDQSGMHLRRIERSQGLEMEHRGEARELCRHCQTDVQLARCPVSATGRHARVFHLTKVESRAPERPVSLVRVPPSSISQFEMERNACWSDSRAASFVAARAKVQVWPEVH